MTTFAVSFVSSCKCGSETHAFIECEDDPKDLRTQVVLCSSCASLIARVPGIAIWIARTAIEARALRLADLTPPEPVL
jgi:hypothetical protein